MTKHTVTIQLEAPENQSDMADIVRDAFPEATSITVDSEDGTSETIFVRKNNA